MQSKGDTSFAAFVTAAAESPAFTGVERRWATLLPTAAASAELAQLAARYREVVPGEPSIGVGLDDHRYFDLELSENIGRAARCAPTAHRAANRLGRELCGDQRVKATAALGAWPPGPIAVTVAR